MPILSDAMDGNGALFSRVDEAAFAAALQRGGAQSFAKSWNELMECIASKSAMLT